MLFDIHKLHQLFNLESKICLLKSRWEMIRKLSSVYSIKSFHFKNCFVITVQEVLKMEWHIWTCTNYISMKRQELMSCANRRTWESIKDWFLNCFLLLKRQDPNLIIHKSKTLLLMNTLLSFRMLTVTHCSVSFKFLSSEKCVDLFLEVEITCTAGWNSLLLIGMYVLDHCLDKTLKVLR